VENGRVIVTGAAGFIGSHVAEALRRRGVDVVGVDNLDAFYAPALKRANVEAIGALDARGSFQFVELDLTNESEVARAFEEVRAESVIHLAAKAGVRPSIEDPVGYAEANVTATSVVLRAAEGTGCARVLVASSSSVYGNNRKTPFAEDDPVNEPISPYAATKRACELIAHTHHHLTGMPVACLRFFTVFGPRQRPDLAIHKFLRAAGSGTPIRMFGNGSTSRDYTYIDDIVTGVLSALERVDGRGYRIWNLGGSDPTPLDELIRIVGEVVGVEPILEQAPMQPGDVDHTWADLNRARAELGFEPETTLREGIARQWAWMQKALALV